MSWTDKKSIEHIKELRDKFKVKTFIETGTFKGVNSQFHANNFKEVLTCEIKKEYYEMAKNRLKYDYNVHIFHMNSADFLKDFVERYKKRGRTDIVIIYLDAHFYDATLKNKFVVLDELKALKNFKNCIIIIHDFDNNLGHITYDNQSLDLKLIKKDLLNVNPDFKLYTNELSSCEPMAIHETTDSVMRENLIYAWLTPRLTFRGILYALPREENIDGLKPIK